MRRFHNPRFAPESLERKLSPSSVVPVAAEVYAHATPDGGSQSIPVTYPGSNDFAPDGTGSDPEPPDGDGSVPQGPPSIPSGPDA